MTSAPNKSTGEVIFSAPIVGSKTEDRVIVEHDEGNWSVGRVKRADRTKFEPELSFSMAELIEGALWAAESNPNISKAFNGQAGKGLAAGLVIALMAIGVIKTEHAK